MHNDHFIARRLRFPLEANARESIPGLLARGVREHVLVHTRPILDAAGVNLRHLGHSQLATVEELKRLAYVTRSSPKWLAERAGERRPGPLTRSLTVDVKFGEHLVPFVYIEVNKRRISPLSLKADDFHRLDWMNLLLPYCPESLEQLIDSCSSCGAKLGWRYARGIGTCEYCGLEVLPTDLPSLPERYTTEYREFAKLSSFDSGEVAEVLATFPAELKKVEPADLVRLTLVVGNLTTGLLARNTSRIKVTTLTAPDLAKVASTGVPFLRSWPTGFQDWVDAEANRLRANTKALNEFRARLRSVIRGREPAAVAELMTKALPELRQHPVHGFARFERYYLATKVQRKLGVTPEEFKRLRRAIGKAYQRSPTTTATFLKGQFDANYIDKLVPSFRGTIAFNSCASTLKLPVYAVAQCCRPSLLEQENCAVFSTVRSDEFIRSGSLAALTEYLSDRRQKIARPAQTVQLIIAARWIGGRLKPWGSILESLQSGKIPYWIEGENVSLRTIYIWPADMRKFLHVADHPFADTECMTNFTVSQLDAAEILNIQPAQLASEATALGIHFRKSGRGFAASLAEVLSTASIVAWSAEIAWHMGASSRDVGELLHRQNISRLHTGWSRQQLISAAMLPKLPV